MNGQPDLDESKQNISDVETFLVEMLSLVWTVTQLVSSVLPQKDNTCKCRRGYDIVAS
jgi:hypothetical protein